MHHQTNKTGKVYITGAGPGDPELITLRGKKILEKADVVIYDRLVNPELLAYSPETSEHIYVGKKPGKPSVSQNRINQILVSKAKDGKTVVRLKGGDPFIFGRGSEECEALASEQVPYEVIPGISSALSAPAFAGIPLTHRTLARSFTVVTGHTLKGTDSFQNWEHLSNADTLVILMGMRKLAEIVETLRKFGRPGDTPVTIVEKATLPNQRIVSATLNSIVEQASGFSSPAVIVVGELAAMSHDLAWFTPSETVQVHQSAMNESLTRYAV
jgi:uroporphyrin-III C-methyltransferase